MNKEHINLPATATTATAKATSLLSGFSSVSHFVKFCWWRLKQCVFVRVLLLACSLTFV